VLVIVACTMASFAAADDEPQVSHEPHLFGAPLTLEQPTALAEVLAEPEAHTDTPVLLEGRVADVCQKKGCWMDIVHPEGLIQVKVEDDVIVFPLSARGKTARVEGTVEALEQTAEQAFAAAAHRAEEQGQAFDSTAVFQPTTVYRVQGVGAVITD